MNAVVRAARAGAARKRRRVSRHGACGLSDDGDGADISARHGVRVA
jgi:hypothetical protein